MIPIKQKSGSRLTATLVMFEKNEHIKKDAYGVILKYHRCKGCVTAKITRNKEEAERFFNSKIN